jgi:ADP-heptose:LPS heptosyltransferase
MQRKLPQRIVVFCLPGIGDAILFTPALALLRRALPGARITVVTMFRGTADVLGTNPDLDEVRYFDFFNAGKLAGLRYVWGLRREGFELSIMPFPSNRLEYNVVNRLVGRRWRAGHRYQHQSWRNLWFLNNIVVREAGTLHNVEENLRLARAICRRLGVPVPEPEPPAELKVVLTAEDEQYAEAFLAAQGIGCGAPLIGFHTYSSTFKNMHRKCWEKDNFVELIRRLGKAYPAARFLIFSGPADEAVNQYIMRHVDSRVVLVREANLRHGAAIMKRCRLFVCNDAALMHLAAALGVPVVALFGPTNWRRLHPWTGRYTIVRKNLPCMPCFYYSSRPLRCVAGIDYACMREISVDEVFAAVETELAQTHAKPLTAPS